MKKKALIALAMVACMLLGVAGTYAYLTAQSGVVTNTFTSGAVAIDLNETDVDEDGNTKANAYKIYPGGTYAKDPTITVEAGSEECYVGAVVTVANWDKWAALFEGGTTEPKFANIHTGLGAGWSVLKEENGVVTLVYSEKVDPTSEIPAIFSAIAIPATADADDLAAINGTITVKAYASQAVGFTGEGAAAAALEAGFPEIF